MNRFQHIDLRVTDMDQARKFYSTFLPAVGFETNDPGENFHCFEDRGHRPNRNRIAFSAASREEVGRIAEIALRAGATNMSGPRECPEYTPTYYAAFFEDPCGNCSEVCHYGE
jgi:predicted lactoylglutathione lyase